MPANQPSPDLLPLFTGKTTDIKLPSGRIVTIRETNGEDDDLLSSINSAKTGDNILNFLSSIVLKDHTTGMKPTPEQIESWPINDKYGLLFEQRIFMYGLELKFEATCLDPECGKKSNYVEDLSKFRLQPDDDDEITSKRLRAYPDGDQKEVEFTISSGKKFKFSILTGELEKRALELKDSTKNSPLVIRDLKIQNAGSWQLVKHFAAFSSREMLEIRHEIKKHDVQFDPHVNFVCSNPQCGKDYSIPLFAIGTFFYPEETL